MGGNESRPYAFGASQPSIIRTLPSAPEFHRFGRELFRLTVRGLSPPVENLTPPRRSVKYYNFILCIARKKGDGANSFSKITKISKNYKTFQ